MGHFEGPGIYPYRMTLITWILPSNDPFKINKKMDHRNDMIHLGMKGVVSGFTKKKTPPVSNVYPEGFTNTANAASLSPPLSLSLSLSLVSIYK